MSASSASTTDGAATATGTAAATAAAASSTAVLPPSIHYQQFFPRWPTGEPIFFMSADVHAFIEIKNIAASKPWWRTDPRHEFRYEPFVTSYDDSNTHNRELRVTELTIPRTNRLFDILKQLRPMTSASVSASQSSARSNSAALNDLSLLPSDVSLPLQTYLSAHKEEYHSHTTCSIQHFESLVRHDPSTLLNGSNHAASEMESLPYHELFRGQFDDNRAASPLSTPLPLYELLLHYLRWLRANGPRPRSDAESATISAIHRAEQQNRDRRERQRHGHAQRGGMDRRHSITTRSAAKYHSVSIGVDEKFEHSDESKYEDASDSAVNVIDEFYSSFLCSLDTDTVAGRQALGSAECFKLSGSSLLTDPYLSPHSPLRTLYRTLYEQLDAFPLPLVELIVEYARYQFDARLVFCFDSYVW